jgi:hypothetical protein
MGTAKFGRFDLGAGASDLAHVMECGRGWPNQSSVAKARRAPLFRVLETHDTHDVMTMIPNVISLSTG